MDQANDTALTIRFSRDMYDALKALAEEEERSLAQVIRRAARAYLQDRATDPRERSRT
jgi:predicted DNA-binding protein